MTIKTVLKKARAFLVKYGWRQNNIGEEGSPMCAIGAINKALHGSTSYQGLGGDYQKYDAIPACRAMAKALGLKNGDGPLWKVANWNNGRGVTKKDVLAGFSRAIKATKT